MGTDMVSMVWLPSQPLDSALDQLPLYYPLEGALEHWLSSQPLKGALDQLPPVCH